MSPFLVGCGRQALCGFRALLGQALSYRVLPQDIKREAWALGGRHQGEVLLGARLESKATDLSLQRAGLLQAVIRVEASAAKTRAATHGRRP